MSDVKSFWDSKGGDRTLNDLEVTHKDIWQRWLEIETVKRHLRPMDRLVDIGCGAGYSTAQFAGHVSSAVGLDYSEEMIRRARQRDRDGAHLEFHVCDVLKLTPADHGTFDIAISTRCLINILDEEQQYRAIDNIAGILKPGGRFVFIEGLSQGRERLNVLRQKVDLPEMPKVWHNLDFEETRLLREMKKRFTILERSDFGTYDLISRVVYPLSIRPDEPKYDAKLNEVAARLALTWGTSSDISRVIVLVLQA